MSSQSDRSERRTDVAALHEFCVQAMLCSGMSRADAEVTAQVLVTTDTWGVYTHGSKQLRPLLRNMRDGRLCADAAPEIAREGPGWALIDGHDAMPMVTSTLAMRTAIAKARATGIAYVGVYHSGHFGAAGYYAVMAALEGLIGLSMCNVEPMMTVPGARGKVLGTNPLAYAIPTGAGHPIFLDVATSTVAASKVFAARALGKSIPGDWLVDEDGVSTTDPSHYPEEGALLPMAGHKGYGLALLIELLSATLTGSAMASQVNSWIAEDGEPSNQGHAFIAIDVDSLMPLAQFGARVDELVAEIRNAPKAKGAQRIYLPGEMEWERRERALAEGLTLPADVCERLAGLAADIGLELTLW
jgi:ureidoglycolate dehydrogenase (NAD+)